MIEISPLSQSDEPAWGPLWQAYLRFYNTSVEPSVTRTTFERLIDDQEPMGGFLARDQTGRCVGMVHWIRHRSCWTVSDYCYLQDLYVDQEQRGSGTGRMLIEAVFAKARSMDCSRVYWLTHESNGDAIRLYDKLAERPGFVQYRKILT